MNIKITVLLFFIVIIGLNSCNNDDDSDYVYEIRDRAEQQVIDNDSILGYLKTHYYNSGYFESTLDPTAANLEIKELVEGEEVPDAYTLIFDDIITMDVNYAETDYTIYYLNLNKNDNQGSDSPTFADDVLVSYEGATLDNAVFDSSVVPVAFDLTEVIPGWGKVMPEFKTALSFDENEDGTVQYMNHGVGVMFLPSGLAYFSTSQTGIAAYSCLSFAFDLYQTTENDHDNDLVPSYLEDYNTLDGEFTVNSDVDVHDGDDTDGDGFPDYFDADDDGDGIPTRNEDIDGDGDPTNDIGKNGIAKYLDPEEIESNES